jgi:hypothetical protein
MDSNHAYTPGKGVRATNTPTAHTEALIPSHRINHLDGVDGMTRRMTTQIPCTQEFKDWVQEQGRMGETYEDVLRRLLDLETLPRDEDG